MRRFEHVEDGAAKFWQVEVLGTTMRVRFGRLGTEGQSKDKELGSAGAAQREAEKLVGEKVKKGYVEVGTGAPAAPPPAAPSPTAKRPATDRRDLELAKQAFDEIEDSTYGELSFTTTPSIVDGFIASHDGERWQKTLEQMEWIAEEADGGAVGYWSHGGDTVVVYLDNEGSFHCTGRRFVDHLSYVADGGEDEGLRTFCKKHKLPPPMGKAARQALSKTVKLPDAVFAELGKAKAKPVKSEPAAKGAQAKGSPKAAKVARGPRPFTRTLAGCELADGRVLIVTGEDFGKSYGDVITKGAVFLFDPATSSFEALPPLALDGASPSFAFASADGATVIASPYEGWMLAYEWKSATRQWAKPKRTPIRAEFGVVARRLPDGRVLLFGGERTEAALGSGSRWEELPDLPEARSYDQVVPLEGRVWILGGEADDGESSFSATNRTWLLDPVKGKWSKGPTLPEPVSRALAFPRADGAVVLIADCDAWVYANGKFGKKVELRELEGTSEVHVRIDEDSLLSPRWCRDDAVIRTSLIKLTAERVGALTLAQGGATPFALRDGRVLFVGGTLFNNNEAEPEIFSLEEGRASALPGWEADVARQAKALAKAREKQAKRGY
jgi:predicted DNA-binding WGR domain protein